MPDAQIRDWMEDKDIRVATDGLIKATLDAGAPDNVTVVIVEASCDPPPGRVEPIQVGCAFGYRISAKVDRIRSPSERPTRRPDRKTLDPEAPAWRIPAGGEVTGLFSRRLTLYVSRSDRALEQTDVVLVLGQIWLGGEARV